MIYHVLRRCLMWIAVVGATLALAGPFIARAPAAEPDSPANSLADVAAGKAQIVDLTYALNERNNFWPGENYHPFALRTIATLERNGVLSKAFSSPEHLGTHLDAPNHFERQRASVDQLAPENLFATGVVIDISAQASADADYRLTRADIDTWERAHGAIAAKSVVLLRTGWGRFWNDPVRYKGQDVRGRLHFPGFSAEAVRFLLDERQVKGVGLDTLSVDYGISTDFVVHHLLGKAGAYGLENVAQLDKLPPRGFYLFVAPIKIETGSGGPVRIFAILPQSAPDGEGKRSAGEAK